MVLGSRSEPLSQLEVLVVDCQATAAAPRGHLLEIGWARVLGTTITHAHASSDRASGWRADSASCCADHGDLRAHDAVRCRRTLRLARAVRPGRESHAAARADGHPLRSIRAAVPSHVGRRRVSARRGLHAGYRQAPSAQSASLQPARPRWILRSRGWCAASKRRSRRCDGVRLARVGRPAREARRVDLGRAPRLARRTCQTDEAADAASGRCRGTCGFHCRLRLGSIACFGRTAASCTSARQRRSIIGSTATFGSRPACPSGCSRCCRRHARSRSTSHQVRSRPRSSSRTKSSGTDRLTTSR